MNTATLSSSTSDRQVAARTQWFAIGAFALVWLELVSRLRFEWSINPQYDYGWTVPFLAAYVFWRRLQSAPPAVSPPSRIPPAMLIILAALLFPPIRVIQEANPDWRLLSWAMAFAAVVITGAGVYLAGGIRWVRHFAFPILFFLVAVPWPTNVEQFVIQGLMRADASINVEVLNAIGIPAVQLGNVIEVGSGFVGIDEACTGIRSLQATFMVSLFLGEFYSFAVARRLALVLAGGVLAFFCNLVRTFLLVWLGAERGSDAIKSWHDPAGHTILMACLLGLWGLSIVLRGKAESPRTSDRLLAPNRIPGAVLASLVALILTAEIGTELWYRSHESRTAKLDPWLVSWPTAATNWKAVPVASSAQDMLRYNEGGGGSWTGEDGHAWTMYFFRWLPGRTAALFIRNHHPDICLPASGMKQHGGAANKSFKVNGVTLPIRSYVFENSGRTLHVYYCYWDGTPAQADSSDQENWTAFGRLDNVRRGKRDIGTQMLEIVAWGYEGDEEAERAAREQLGKIVRPG